MREEYGLACDLMRSPACALVMREEKDVIRTAARVPVGLLGAQLLEGRHGHARGVHWAGRYAAVALRPVRRGT